MKLINMLILGDVMKKVLVVFILILMLFVFTTNISAEMYFRDILNHWSANDVNKATNVLNLFNGYGDMTFRPDNNISRSEFIAIIVRASTKIGIMEEVYTSDMEYEDLSYKDWAYTYIVSMYEYMKNNFTEYTFEDIFEGNVFEPNKYITREEVVKLVGVLCNNPLYDNDIYFNDITKNYKYYNQVKDLCNAGVLQGYDDNTLKLDKFISRGESASLIIRIYDYLKVNNKKYSFDLMYSFLPEEATLPLFATYDYKNMTDEENKYVKAKNTLEYLEFGGYVFDEDKELYDLRPIDTLRQLRKSKFNNVIGVNFYLLKYANLSDEEINNMIYDILVILDKDIEKYNDTELIQLFYLLKDFDIRDKAYLKVLNKWYNNTDNKHYLFDIKVFILDYCMNVKNEKIINEILYNNINNSNLNNRIWDINWDLILPQDGTLDNEEVNSDNLDNHNNNDKENTNGVNNKKLDKIDEDSNMNNIGNTDKIDFRDLSLTKLYFDIFTKDIFKKNIGDSLAEKYIILKDYVLVNVDRSFSDLNINLGNEELFYKNSMNNIYMLYNIGQYQRAFIEAMNDYKIIKHLSIYKVSRIQLDEDYIGIMKYLKKLIKQEINYYKIVD